MKKIFPILLLSILLISGCWTDDDMDCETSFSCVTIPPEFGDLTIKVTIDAENPVVPVTIFLGNFEDGDTIYHEDLTSESRTFEVWVDEKYSATAIYQQGGNTIRAIDGDRVVLKSEEDCYETCYTVNDGNINLRLK